MYLFNPMRISESKWTASICKELRNKGALIIPIVGGPMQMSGLPDRCMFHADLPKSVWLEFKGEHTVLGTNQKILMANMNRINACSAFILRFPSNIQYAHYEENGNVVILDSGWCFNDATSLLRILRKIIVGSKN